MERTVRRAVWTAGGCLLLSIVLAGAAEPPVAGLLRGEGGALLVTDASGNPVARLGGDGDAPAYLRGAGTEHPFVAAHVQEAAGALLGAVDGDRAAQLEVVEDGDGTVLLRFTVEGKGEFESLGVRIRLAEREGFYGLTERAAPGGDGRSWAADASVGLDLWGSEVRLYTLPTLSAYVPFAVSSSGYGLWLEGSWPSVWRFGVDAAGAVRDAEVTIETEDDVLRLRVIPGPTPVEAVERFARRTGTSVLPPRWAFGPYRWRDEVWNLPRFSDGSAATVPYNSMIVEDVLMMDALDIPCTMYAIDRPWGEGTFGYGAMTVDSLRMPGFADMVGWLRRRDIRPILFLGPWVFDELRSEVVSRGFHVPNTLFYPVGSELIDFANAEAVAFWQERLAAFVDLGVAGFKLDRGEEKTPDGQLFRGSYADGTPFREGHNAYPLWFAAAGAGALAGVDGGGLNIVRATWTGSSSYAAVWGGDSDPSFEGLRAAIIALLRCSAMNLPIWGSDTGGYNTRPPRELLARWLAFSAFCPLMEVGPMANLAPWAWLADDADGEVGADGYPPGVIYDRELLAIWHLYAHLHNDLADYTYDQARRANEQGTPIVRSMALAYPGRPDYVDMWQQYLFGPDLLVRPVWEEGATAVEVALPDGTWLDAWTGAMHLGPATVTVPVPLHVAPAFVRAGGAVDLGDLGERWDAAQRAVAEPPDLAGIVGESTW